MPTLNEIVSSIRDQVTGRVPVDDTRLRNRFLFKLVADKRALLIRQEGERGLGISTNWTQTIDCLKVQQGTLSCEGRNTLFQQQYLDAPDLIQDHNSILYLGTLDGLTPFRYTGLSGFLHAMPGRFGKTTPVYTVNEGKILLKFNPCGLTYLRLVAALADPSDPDKAACALIKLDEHYPVPPAFVHQLELLVIKQLLSTQPIPADTVNNAMDDTGSTPVNPNTLN